MFSSFCCNAVTIAFHTFRNAIFTKTRFSFLFNAVLLFWGYARSGCVFQMEDCYCTPLRTKALNGRFSVNSIKIKKGICRNVDLRWRAFVEQFRCGRQSPSLCCRCCWWSAVAAACVSCAGRNARTEPSERDSRVRWTSKVFRYSAVHWRTRWVQISTDIIMMFHAAEISTGWPAAWVRSGRNSINGPQLFIGTECNKTKILSLF